MRKLAAGPVAPCGRISICCILMALALWILSAQAANACLATPTPTPTPTPAPVPDVDLKSQPSAFAVVWAPPLPPVNLTVALGGGDPTTQLQLSWADRSGRETGFQVERSLSGAGPWENVAQTGPGVTSSLQTGLTPGALYYFRVRSLVRGEVQSASSNVASLRTSPASPKLSVSIGSGGSIAQVQWSPAPGSLTYDVYRIDGNGNRLLIADDTTSTSLEDSNLTPDADYSYEVVATNPDGASTSPAAPPTPATRWVQQFKSATGIRLAGINEWGCLSHRGALYENAQPRINYLMQNSATYKLWTLSGSGGAAVAAVVMQSNNVTTYSAGDMLIKGSLFVNESNAINRPSNKDPFSCYRLDGASSQTVASIDAAGNLKVLEYDKGGPHGLLATALDCRSIKLTWYDAKATELTPYTFSIERSTTSTFAPVTVTTATMTRDKQYRFTYVDNSLSSGTQHFYRVGRQIGSRIWKSRDAAAWTRPGRVHFTTAVAFPYNKVALAWEPPSGAMGFRIYRAANGSGAPLTYTPDSFFLDEDKILSAGTTYAYTVRAVGPGGDSPVTATTSAVTLPDPTISLSAIDIGDQQGVAAPVVAYVTSREGELTTYGLTLPATLSPKMDSSVVLEALDGEGLRAAEGWSVDGQNISFTRYAKIDITEPRNYAAVVRYAPFTCRWVFPSSEASAVNPQDEIKAAFNINPKKIDENNAAYKIDSVMAAYSSVLGKIGLTQLDPDTYGAGYYAFRPTVRYRAGEQVQVTLKTSTQSDGDNPISLPRPYVGRYTIAASDANQQTMYKRAMMFAADAPGTITCLAPVSLFSDKEYPSAKTLQTAVGYYGGQNRIALNDDTSPTISMTFDALANESTSQTKTTAIVVADMNTNAFDDNDNNIEMPDFVVGNDGGRSAIYISGMRDGKFAFLRKFMFGAGEATRAVAVGDLDGDGYNDVVLGNRFQSGSVYFNKNGTGILTNRLTFGGSRNNVTALALADMDLDGDLDIVTVSYGGQGRIYLNDGTGVFATDDQSSTSTISFGAPGALATSLAVANLSGAATDAYPDIVVGIDGGPSKVYLNHLKQKKEFEEALLLDEQENPASMPARSVVAADFNGDGFIDIALSGNARNPAAVFLQQAEAAKSVVVEGERIPVFRQKTGLSGAGLATSSWSVSAMAAADYDDDGDIDLAAALSNGTGRLFLRGEMPLNPSPFYSPGATRNCYAYDWAVKMPADYKFKDAPSWRMGLTESQDGAGAQYYDWMDIDYASADDSNDIQFQHFHDYNPALATDGKGHWVLAWSSGNNLPYDESHTPAGKFPRLHDYNLGDDQDIVISRFWEGRGTVQNKFQPSLDHWCDLLMDLDTLWSPPEPIDADAMAYDREASDAIQDEAPSIATDGRGTWVAVWVAWEVYPAPLGPDNAFKPRSGLRRSKPRLMKSVSYNDATTWSAATVWSTEWPDLGLPNTSIVAPKIVCDQSSPTAHWLCVYPKKAPDREDADIYASIASATQAGQPLNWQEVRICDLKPRAGTADPADDGVENSTYPLDVATDGYGRWMVAWTSSLRSLEHYPGDPNPVLLNKAMANSKDTEILFSFSTNNGQSWTHPSWVNSNATTDNGELHPNDDDVGEPNPYDSDPSIITDGDRWMVFWRTSNAYCATTNYSNVKGDVDGETGGIGGWDHIAYAEVTSDTLTLSQQADVNGNKYYLKSPWTNATILNPDALELHSNTAPRAFACPGGQWLVVWAKGANYAPRWGKQITAFATSRDEGRTWNADPGNMIYSPDIPPQNSCGGHVIAGNALGDVTLAWSVSGSFGQGGEALTADRFSLQDGDIATGRTGALLGGYGSLMDIPPASASAGYSSDIETTSTMVPQFINNITSFPAGLEGCTNSFWRPMAYPGALRADGEWNVERTNADSSGTGSVAIFHMPILQPGSEIKSAEDIKSIALAFRAGRQLAASYSVYVFKAGRYGPGDWNNPAAWEMVGSTRMWPLEWPWMAEKTVWLTRNFDLYLNPNADALGGGFGRATQDVLRTTGTLTWALVSIAADNTPGALQVDWARARVHRRYIPQRAVLANDLPLSATALTLWARMDDDQVVPEKEGGGAQCPTTGEARLTLYADAQGRGHLKSSLLFSRAMSGMQVRLRGYAPQGENPASGALRELHMICTLGSNGTATGQDDWIFSGQSGLNAQAFTAALLEGKVYIELTAPDNASGVVRGQIEPDSDDDYLTDAEERAVHFTDPYDRDSDDDGLLDGEEALHRGRLAWLTAPTDPLVVDSDGDNLADGLEAGLTTQTLFGVCITTATKNVYGTWMAEPYNHPIKATARPASGDIHDLFKRPLCDRDPSTLTNPANSDTDGDGFLDGPDIWTVSHSNFTFDDEEAETASEDGATSIPLYIGFVLQGGEDKDGDGKIDRLGVDQALDTEDDEFDPNNAASRPPLLTSILAYDADGDGLSNPLEEELGTLPNDCDSDDDGVKDGDEVFIYHTLPKGPDSDADGMPDGCELALTQAENPDGSNSYNSEWFGDIDQSSEFWFKHPATKEYTQSQTFLAVPSQAHRSDPLSRDSNCNGIADLLERDAGTDPLRGIVRTPDDVCASYKALIGIEPAEYVRGFPPVNRNLDIFLKPDYDAAGDPFWGTTLHVSLGATPEASLTLQTQCQPSNASHTQFFWRGGQYVSSVTVRAADLVRQADGRFTCPVEVRCPNVEELTSLKVMIVETGQAYRVGRAWGYSE